VVEFLTAKVEEDRTMTVIRMTATPERDGALHLTVPVGADTGTFDVAIVVTPTAGAEQPGWPAGYFARTYGSISDELFVAPPRPAADPVEPLG
jgi:hypothetical protein